MTKFIILISLLTTTSLLFSQKSKIELFETDRFKILETFEGLDLKKKFFSKVQLNDNGSEMVLCLSNNQVMLDAYLTQRNEFKGGVGIYEMDFVLFIRIEMNESDEAEESFTDFNYQDGKTEVFLIFREQEGFKKELVEVADGFIRCKNPNDPIANFKFALLLNKFYSVNGQVAINQEKDIDVSEK